MTPEQVMADAIWGIATSLKILDHTWENFEDYFRNVAIEVDRKDCDISALSAFLAGSRYYAFRNRPPIVVGFDDDEFWMETVKLLVRDGYQDLIPHTDAVFESLKKQITFDHDFLAIKLRDGEISKEGFLENMQIQEDFVYGWIFMIVLAKITGEELPQYKDLWTVDERGIAVCNMGKRLNDFCRDWWQAMVNHLQLPPESE